jgi:hypothetical protein
MFDIHAYKYIHANSPEAHRSIAAWSCRLSDAVNAIASKCGTSIYSYVPVCVQCSLRRRTCTLRLTPYCAQNSHVQSNGPLVALGGVSDNHHPI